MKRESVLDLKAAVAFDLTLPANQALLPGAGRATPLRLGFAADSAAVGVQRGVSLGVAAGDRKGDYKLAVRIRRHPRGDTDLLAQHIGNMASGGVDVRYVGRIAKQLTDRNQAAPRRPLVPGLSIGRRATTAGTLGFSHGTGPAGKPSSPATITFSPTRTGPRRAI
jgi:hypothetical protein